MSKLKNLQASKWIELPVLASLSEMRSLVQGAHLYSISEILEKPQEEPLEVFVSKYEAYLESLFVQPLPLKGYLLTVDPATVFFQPIDNRCAARALWPTIFLKPHQFDFSPLDQKFRSKVYGKDSISWGFSIAYPQFFLDPDTNQPEKIDERYANTPLFKSIQKQVRTMTVPTPFMWQGETIKAPLRLGKECLLWINRHKQLQARGLTVA